MCPGSRQSQSLKPCDAVQVCIVVSADLKPLETGRPEPCDLPQVSLAAPGKAAHGSGAAVAGRAQAHFELAVPGLTLPWAQAGYLWVATALSMAVHEVG